MPSFANVYFVFSDFYYVVDSGFPILKGFLAPYRNHAYHPSEFRQSRGIRTKEDLFNYRHSSVRNVIERCFGVLKARFKILKNMSNYPMYRQSNIPTVCCALHNFIRLHDCSDQLFASYGEDVEAPEVRFNAVQEGGRLDFTENAEMVAVRESIANMLWAQYRGP